MGENRLGIDIGSTTIKLAVMDGERNVLFSEYRRHLSNIQETFLEMANRAHESLGDISFTAMITGSGGLNLADWAGIRFIQEVEAIANAIALYAPQTDVAIEIGGEDAKIIYFGKSSIEQRMNGICAGGTGSFIDQMAVLLQTDAEGLNALAREHTTIYPIAARCGVFAKSDLQPLVNEGTAKPDLAVSIFQATVSQIISGLACGRPIRGKVAFLGGPLYFLPELRKRFIEVLALSGENIVAPDNSHLFAALGAAVSSGECNPMSLNKLISNLKANKSVQFEINRLDPLFKNENDYAVFRERHSRHAVKRAELSTYKGNVFLGIDAGSTTTKAALIGENGELLHTFYAHNQGNPLKMVREALIELYGLLPPDAVIRHSCVTGYGEGLIQAAFLTDMGEVETVAHYRAAAFFDPEVDFLLDIGGQDMKCLRIKNGVIDSVLLNEACSAGCGSFIETFANSLGYKAEEFAKIALFAENPIDLGSRCTVFMNSRVKQAQKEGAHVSDISAGLAFSVIKNALLKVIKITDPAQMGKRIVVQGGTFYNDAVLRAFEIVSGREAVRPDIAGIMGAFGAALIAKENYTQANNEIKIGLTAQDILNGNIPQIRTSLLTLNQLESFSAKASHTRCKGCGNNCLLTINHFNYDEDYAASDEKHLHNTYATPQRFISGNRCERGLGRDKTDADIPNLFQKKYERLFDYEPLQPDRAPRGTVGIPRVLNLYENYPLWHTFFTELGYAVILSPRSSRSLYEKGMESIPSESECYPAKIAHGHIMSLIEQGVKYIFYPSIPFEHKYISDADHYYNCPIVTSYPENIKNNMEELGGVRFHNPFFNLNHPKSLVKRLVEEFPDIPAHEVRAAAKKALEEQARYRRDMQVMGEQALEYMERHNLTGVVLAGRPYHVDPELNHGVPELITSYHVAVLTDDSVSHLGKVERPLNVRDQWSYHSRVYAAAHFARTRDDLELIQLNSFGCGLDAVAADEVRDILENAGRVYTLLKIDEISNLGSARIRVRSLFAALKDRMGRAKTELLKRPPRVVFTKKMRAKHTILAPQMSPVHFGLLQEAFNASGYNMLVIPAFDSSCIDTGLKYVNNDACYPAIVVVGQVLKALFSGEYDINNTSILMVQTGYGCRLTNYVGFIRRALKNANMPHIPVVSLSAMGLEKNPGMVLTPGFINKVLQSVIYGDVLMQTLNRTRPYEAVPGSAEALYNKWNEICKNTLRKKTFSGFARNCKKIVEEFDRLPLVETEKPRVGVVGEIFVKYSPTANNNIVSLLESEGAEAVVPDLTDFLLHSSVDINFNTRNLGIPLIAKFVLDAAFSVFGLYRGAAKKALSRSARFRASVPVRELGEMASPIISLGNQTGEGWFLTGEMVELLTSGVNNIVCVQPFACLPNHVMGKGVIKALRGSYPLSNIVAVDYDPGASEVNQLNRIKLMLSAARRNMKSEKSKAKVH